MPTGTIWNHSNGYNTPSVTEQGNQNDVLNHVLDPTAFLTDDGTGFVQGFWNDLMGFTSQSREFSQQEYLMDKENAYNTPYQQMKRMKEAGINPNIAAAAIAGNGNISAQPPQVPSNGSGVADGVGALATAADAVTGGSASLAKAAFDRITAKPQAGVLISERIKNLEDAGWSHTQAVGAAIDNYYKEPQHIADLNIKSQQFENMKKDWEYVDEQKKFVTKQLERYDELINSEVELNKKKSLEAEKHAFYLDESKKSTQLENDFFERWGFHSDSNVDVSLRNEWLRAGETGDYTRYNGMLNSAYDYYNNVASAEYNADPFNRAYNEAYTEMQRLYNVQTETDNLIGEIEKAFEEGKISSSDYKYLREKLDEQKKAIAKSIKEVNRAVMKLNYSAGHASMLQNISEDLAKIGIVVGVGKAIQPTAKPIGFKKY